MKKKLVAIFALILVFSVSVLALAACEEEDESQRVIPDFELYHGECVALGTVAAAYISWKRGMLSMEEYYEIRDMFVPFYLPITVEGIDPQEILRLTKSDKKMSAGKIRFVLLKKIGKAVIDHTVTDEEILEAVREIYFSEEDAHE